MQSGPLFETVLEMAVALDGLLDVMRSPKRNRRADFDLIHEPTGVHIEVDEEQHFSTHRLKTFDFYGPAAALGYELDNYRASCRIHGPRIDRSGWATKYTPNFGPRSRARQRAFYDSMKDLVLPSIGKPHLIRVEVIDRDTDRAWTDNRNRIFAAIDRAV